MVISPVYSQSSVEETKFCSNLPSSLNLWLKNRVAGDIAVSYTDKRSISHGCRQISKRCVWVGILTYLCPAGTDFTKGKNVILRHQFGENKGTADRRIEIRAIVDRQCG